MSKIEQIDLVHSLYKSRNILLEILRRRGYDISDYINTSNSEISKIFANKQLDMVLENDSKKIYVKYHLTSKLRPNLIYEITDDLFNIEEILTEDDELIIITKDKPNDTLVKLMLPKVKIKKTGQKEINYYLDQQILVMIKIERYKKVI